MKVTGSKPSLLLLILVFASCVSASAAEPQARPNGPNLSLPKTLLRLKSRLTRLDCSHLVHRLYENAGLPYRYATSRVLYRGTEEFRRVSLPNPGDLVVWRGHVGIVVDPSQHIFLSALRSGIKTASYQSGYWKRRGIPRFMRYAPLPESA